MREVPSKPSLLSGLVKGFRARAGACKASQTGPAAWQHRELPAEVPTFFSMSMICM